MFNELWLMFSGAFLAATLLPGGSEVLFVFLLKQAHLSPISLWLAATLGNVLGSLTSFYLGRLGRLAKSPEDLTKKRYRHALQATKKYGYWSLIFAWLPFVGDLLCVFAGWLKLPFWPSCLMIFLGKGIRYLLIIIIFLSVETF